MSDLTFFAQRTTGWATSVWATSEKGNLKNERMSDSDPGEKIEWGADSEHRKYERIIFWIHTVDVSVTMNEHHKNIM